MSEISEMLLCIFCRPLMDTKHFSSFENVFTGCRGVFSNTSKQLRSSFFAKILHGHFRKKASLKLLDMVLNSPLGCNSGASIMIDQQLMEIKHAFI